MWRGGDLSPARQGRQPACAGVGARGRQPADAADALGHPEPRPVGGRDDLLQSAPQPVDRHLQGSGLGLRGLPHESSGPVREPDERIHRPGGHRARPLCHLRGGRPQLRRSPSSGTTSRSTSGSASPSTASWPTTRSCARQLLGDDDNHLARETDTEIFMHEICTALSVEDRPSLVEVFRQTGREIRRRLQPGLPRCPGRHGGGPRSAGHQAAVLCGRGAAVRGGQRERRPDEPGLRAAEHQVAAAGPGDRHQRGAAGDSRPSPPARGTPIASSNGSTSPTSPARWTGGASTLPARPWARSWPGWRRSPSTSRRWSCPCPTPARRPPTPWPMP